MAEIKRSKKNVLMVSILICILSATLIALQMTSASPGDPNLEVTGISPVTYPDWDSPSYNLTFGVFVKNSGNESETFTLTLYNDTNPISTKNVTLASQTEELVKFTLPQPALSGFPDDAEQAWPYPKHTNIWANATTVEGDEIDHCNTTTVTVRWTGDFNGDGHVDQTDDYAVSQYYSNCTYSVYVDFNGDGTISVVDVIKCYINQGKGPKDYHDLVINSISPVTYPDWDSPSYNLTFGVFVKNQGKGNYTENFNITIYNGTSPIGTKNVTLAPQTEELITFNLPQPALPGFPDDLDPPCKSYPTHNIWAKTVPNRTITDVSVYGNTTVTVRWTGDFNGDGHVDQTDDYAVSQYYSNCTYSVYVDFDGDGTISIADVAKCSINQHKGPLDYCDITISNVTLSNRNRPFFETLSWVYSNSTNNVSTINVVVAVKNNGNTTETCTVKAYYKLNDNDWIIIGNTSATDLAPNETRSVTILWNVPSIDDSFPYNDCTVNATVLPFLYEDNKTNNWKLSDSVPVRWAGDITGDGRVNDDDLTGPFREALDSYSKHSDFNGDGVLDTEDVKILIDNWKSGPKDPSKP